MEKILDAYQLVGRLSRFYDGMLLNSGLFERAVMKFFWGLDKSAYEKFLNQAFAGIPKDFNGRLLEVPVGTGVLSLPVYQKLNGAEIFCVDLSDKMLDVAKSRSTDLNLRGVKFLQGDVANLPFDNNFFDIVLSINGFHAFSDKVKALMETRRVLKVDGTFCGSVYVKGENRRTDLFVKSFCERHGFFSPPYETLTSLQEKLREYYNSVTVTHVESFAGFICTNKK